MKSQLTVIVIAALLAVPAQSPGAEVGLASVPAKAEKQVKEADAETSLLEETVGRESEALAMRKATLSLEDDEQ